MLTIRLSTTPPSTIPVALEDDCDDDKASDIPISVRQLSLTNSPPSAPSVRPKPSLTKLRHHPSSPLRNSFTGKPSLAAQHRETEEDAEFDFDLPDSFPARSRSTTASSSSFTLRNLSSTTNGPGPSGIGAITRLGAPPSSLPKGTIREKAKAMEKSWEADLDFGDIQEGPKKPLTLSLPKKKATIPDHEEWDDLGFDLEDDEATIKASATLKSKLPPPRPRAKHAPPNQDPDELEPDFILPLNFDNLQLATRLHSKLDSRSRPGPRASHGSNVADFWDSPSTSPSSKQSPGRASWSEDSPKRFWETSATSISDGLSHKNGKNRSMDEDDDMEAGLIVDPTFFSSTDTRHLEALLDRKRRSQPEQAEPRPHRHDSFDEDGLILHNPKAELTLGRLSRSKRAREANVPRKMSGEKTEKEKAWEREREQGWNRPLQATQERAQGSYGQAGLRSHSATTGQRTDYSFGRGATRPRSSLNDISMGPPPIPPPAIPSSSSKLRSQKSHFNLGPPSSPSRTLARKQSLPFIPNVPQSPSASSMPERETPARQYNSVSRYTAPTRSSLARARLPVTDVFPASSSASSISTSGSAGQIATPRSRQGGEKFGMRGVDGIRRHGGLEMGLDDLPEVVEKPIRRGELDSVKDGSS